MGVCMCMQRYIHTTKEGRACETMCIMISREIMDCLRIVQSRQYSHIPTYPAISAWTSLRICMSVVSTEQSLTREQDNCLEWYINVWLSSLPTWLCGGQCMAICRLHQSRQGTVEHLAHHGCQAVSNTLGYTRVHCVL